MFFVVAAAESSPLLFLRSNMQPRIKKETNTNNANSDSKNMKSSYFVFFFGFLIESSSFTAD